MEATDAPKVTCSFCGKSQHEVRKLIAGPSVYVCNECIVLMQDILHEEAAGESGEANLAEAFAGVVGQQRAVQTVKAVLQHHALLSGDAAMHPMSVLLVGPRGVGKSVIGRSALAASERAHEAAVERLLGYGRPLEDFENLFGPMAEKAGPMYGVVFVDSLEQLAVRPNSELTERVQRLLIRLLDGCSFTAARYPARSTERVLVIGAVTVDAAPGSGDELREQLGRAGLLPQLVGRFQHVVLLDPLPIADLRKILDVLIEETNRHLKPIEASVELDAGARDALLESVEADPDGAWALRRAFVRLVPPAVRRREAVAYTRDNVLSPVIDE